MPKQIVITKLGGPEVLNYQTYSLPKIIKNKEVRIRHTAIGLNYIDTYHRSGLYPLPSKLPVCLGMEAAGEIIEIGNDRTVIKDASGDEDLIISDLNTSNVNHFTDVSEPESEYFGYKWFYTEADGWSLNENWVDPRIEQEPQYDK